MNNAQPAIQFDRVSVRYRVPRERVSGIKEYAIRWLQRRWLQRKIEFQDFWALHQVSFAIQPGEFFGIIGRNGAGKSTLLKVMARVLKPVEGRVVMRGRIAPLLELGGAFHPELTGRENVFLNMALLGHSRRQAQEMFAAIVDFAEIGDFMEAPLRTYSTGMVSRLGFAVATCLRPDILLVDEVLSVGDSWFQEKCLERMNTFQRQGTTIVLVSHAMAAIETFCQRAAWLENGCLQAMGTVDQVIEQYRIAGLDGTTVPQGTELPFQKKGDRNYGTAVLHYAASKRETAASVATIENSPAARNQPPVLIPRAEPGKEYVTFDPVGEQNFCSALYSAQGCFNVAQGAVAVEVKLLRPIEQATGKVAAIFHTDDSRYVLSITTEQQHSDQTGEDPGRGNAVWNSSSGVCEARKIVARAGGNRRAFDTFYGMSEFPEASALVISPDSPQEGLLTGTSTDGITAVGTSAVKKTGTVTLTMGAWHQLVMTWNGYPDGVVCLYVNGKLISQNSYDHRHDRGDHLPTSIAIGFRPLDWWGEMLRDADGGLIDSRPQSDLAVAEAGLEIRQARLYQRVLTEVEIFRDYETEAVDG